MGFLNAGYKKAGIEKAANPVIDTLELQVVSLSSNLKIID